MAAPGPEPVALVHDYLTQRGGAERVVVAMHGAFPRAAIYTSLYDRSETFPELQSADIRPSVLNRVGVLVRHHRVAFPVLAPVFNRTRLDAEVTVCSSSGWAHGVRTTGRKVVYCHTPARWLYQKDRYLGDHPNLMTRTALSWSNGGLRAWDRSSAAGADRYLVNSSEVQRRVRTIYGRDSEVLPPPPLVSADDPQVPVEGIDDGFWLCVSRLMPYKNVDVVVEAFAQLGCERLVVVGSGPERARLEAAAPSNVTFLGRVSDAQLRWLYAHSFALVAASYEDFGLTPLEAAVFGKPVAAFKWGGYLDTVDEGVNGHFFAAPGAAEIRDAVLEMRRNVWPAEKIELHARQFSEERFIGRLRQVVDEERSLA